MPIPSTIAGLLPAGSAHTVAMDRGGPTRQEAMQQTRGRGLARLGPGRATHAPSPRQGLLKAPARQAWPVRGHCEETALIHPSVSHHLGPVPQRETWVLWTADLLGEVTLRGALEQDGQHGSWGVTGPKAGTRSWSPDAAEKRTWTQVAGPEPWGEAGRPDQIWLQRQEGTRAERLAAWARPVVERGGRTQRELSSLYEDTPTRWGASDAGGEGESGAQRASGGARGRWREPRAGGTRSGGDDQESCFLDTRAPRLRVK